MMDDKEMIYLQKRDCASCAVWEWIKSDCWKRTRPDLRELSLIEKEGVAGDLGIDVERFDAIVDRLRNEVQWMDANGAIKGWDKWQSVNTKVEDAARKRVEYWKARTDEYDTPELPDPLDTTEFRIAWEEYEKYRRQNGWKKLKPMSVSKLWGEIVSWGGVDQGIAAINQTITKGWQGIFPPKEGVAGKMEGKKTSYAGKLWALETHKKSLQDELNQLREWGGAAKKPERVELSQKIKDINDKIKNLDPEV